MKKKIIFIAATIMAAAGIAVAAEYHFGFILSCGQTIYRSFDHPLSETELLEWTDLFEDTRCAGNDGPIELID